MEGYKWSSYNEYLGKQWITDIGFALGLMSREEFVAYMNEENQDKSIESEEDKIKLTDAKLTEKIVKKYRMKPMMIQNEPRDEINRILKEILQQDGVSTRQLSRVTGVSRLI
ncbi:MAG: hypothetical protein GX111_02395 [Clostridiales bacterium]|nr:hypothetical protein [Clostridiales bacterium]